MPAAIGISQEGFLFELRILSPESAAPALELLKIGKNPEKIARKATEKRTTIVFISSSSYETYFEITILPPGTRIQRDDIYFNLGALET
jgi:hypothetical protein